MATLIDDLVERGLWFNLIWVTTEFGRTPKLMLQRGVIIGPVYSV